MLLTEIHGQNEYANNTKQAATTRRFVAFIFATHYVICNSLTLVEFEFRLER